MLSRLVNACLGHRSLRRIFNHHAFDTKSAAHLCIDVQKNYCNTPEKQTIAARIGAQIVPAFRAAGLRTYWIYFKEDKGDAGPYEAKGGLYQVSPLPHETIIGKDDNSAFTGSDISDHLHADGIKTLFLTGFNADFCVYATAKDALRQKFSVVVLQDATNYRPRTKLHYRWLPLAFARTDEVMAALASRKTPLPEPA